MAIVFETMQSGYAVAFLEGKDCPQTERGKKKESVFTRAFH